MMSQLWLEISKGVLESNYRAVRARVCADGAPRLVMAVVKANAYGHGVSLVAPVLDAAGVDWFGVYSVEEAVQLSNLGITKPMLILGPVESTEVPEVVRRGYRVWLDSHPLAEALAAEARVQNRTAYVHISIDTGMSREGFWFDDAVSAVQRVHQLAPHLEIEGIGTHFASAENPEADSQTSEQIERFTVVLTNLDELGIKPAIISAANSAGLLRHPGSHFTMVRTGAALYGLALSSQEPDIAPIGSLKARVARVKKARPGERVGYGGTYTTMDDATLLQIGAGYADGLNRYLANNAHVLVGPAGEDGLVCGTISMNTTMVVISGDYEPAEGDEIVFIGTAGNKKIAAEQYSETIPNLRVPHIFTQLNAVTVDRVLVE
jgi:alanine racemase